MMLAIEDAVRTTQAIEQLEETVYGGASEGRPQSSGRRRAVLAMVAGVAIAALASVTLVHRASLVPEESGARGRPPAPAPVSSGLMLGGPTDVTIQMATYEPGQTSGWHSHTGMHAVMVLSGTLTFYDGQCEARTYGPGDAYVGGQGLHLARNETDTPVELAVTYMFPTGASHTTFHVPAPAPAGCDIG